MTHYMKLNPIPFSQIKNGTKTIELRLWDEKRRAISVGDLIVFTCADGDGKIQARVAHLHRFPDFESLYNTLPLEKCGYTADELSSAKHTDMEEYYTKEQIETYGVVGIELCDIDGGNAIKDVIYHYDLLIEEGNDPVYDPEPLREYMDRWDGSAFIDSMKLSLDKSVLEIGVGSGRLAIRTAPRCKVFHGIDISPKTVEKAKCNLSLYANTEIFCGDFLTFDFDTDYDVVYSSLTFMHIRDKQSAVYKTASLLKSGGRFVLSVDKNQSNYIDYGTRRLEIYPDSLEDLQRYITASGLILEEIYETEAAYVLISVK